MLMMIKTWIISAVVFIGLDGLWLTKIMGKEYTKKLGYLASLVSGKIQFNLLAGLLAQLVIVSGILFVLFRTITEKSGLSGAMMTGAFLGFVIYATYDLTNLSFIKNWPLSLSLIDIAWGTFQGLVVGTIFWHLNFK